ncbi:slc44a2 [Symbiodinium pilosum]|uniref:Slc44a2 protein n=1 Tax=Symbiodinium pilosum TaxID=2952 RepID=A0A812SJL6_SYMPI|nr:slc44a2 [Symbiodinium pilosum]
MAFSLAALTSTIATIVLSTHFWWTLRKNGQDYLDALNFVMRARDASTKPHLYVQKARIRLFNMVNRICIQSTLACAILLSTMVINMSGTGEVQLLLLISMYTGCSLVSSEFISLTPATCDLAAALGHFLLLLLALCPASDSEVVVGGVRALLRVLSGMLFLDAKKTFSANVVQKLLEENTSLRFESVEVAGKSQARKNLLSVLVDADIMLDSSFRVCQPSNKAEHFFGPELSASETSVGGLKLHQFVADADQTKLTEFLNHTSINNVSDSMDVLSESSISLQGGGSPASSLSIQLGKSGRVVQIFHSSIPAADITAGSQPQPRHLVGIQESFSMARHDVREVLAPDLPMDQSPDAELMYLSTQNLAAQQQSFETRQKRPPSTGSRGSRESKESASKKSASSASSLRSSVLGLPEVGSISFIFNGYSEGLSIVEATLRFDTLRGKKDEPGRVPEMKHWIRSKCWDDFRNWVQMETQRCCAGAAVGEVRSFEGPLEFYYPGQPDMTLVSGSVNVVRIQSDGDSDFDAEEGEEEEPVCDMEVDARQPQPGAKAVAVIPRSATNGSDQAGSGESADSLGGNASPLEISEDEAHQEAQVCENPFYDGDVNEEVDALLVEVECKAFSQYRSLNTKSRKSKRYGHLRRQPPLEPSLDAIEEGP